MKMIKNISLVLGLLLCFSLGIQAQQLKTQEQNDPKAVKIMKSLKAKYDAFKSITADFSLTIEIPEADKEVMKGSMIQQGEDYNVKMGNQTILSDNESLWIIMHDVEEVQIMDADDQEEGFLSPKDLMNIYEKGDYIYALANEGYSNGKYVQEIEFKPVDRNSEYSKLRLTIDKKKNEIVSIKVFSRDGSRYTLAVTGLKTNTPYKKSTFQYNKSEFPDYMIEDLRI